MTEQVIQLLYTHKPIDVNAITSSIKSSIADLEAELEGVTDKTKIYNLRYRIFSLGTLLKALSEQ